MTAAEQMTLEGGAVPHPPPGPEPPEHRVRALAGILAGFRWPDRGSYEALTKPQRRAAWQAASDALARLQETE